MATNEKVMEALTRVMDPELGVNVVDLGLIYHVAVEGGKALVTMTLTTQGCPLHDSIIAAVKAAVQKAPGVEEVQVRLVWEPAWSPERMSEAARKQLIG